MDEDLDDFLEDGEMRRTMTLFGSSGRITYAPEETRYQQAAKASTASNVGGGECLWVSQIGRYKKPVRNLSLRGGDQRFDGHSWGQDNADLDELLGGLSTWRAEGPWKAEPTKKAKNSSLLGPHKKSQFEKDQFKLKEANYSEGPERFV